jgi:hypothetical protein
MNSHGTVDSIFLLYDILGEVIKMSSHGTVDSMFLSYDIRREVREMNSLGTVDRCSYYITSFGKLER